MDPTSKLKLSGGAFFNFLGKRLDIKREFRAGLQETAKKEFMTSYWFGEQGISRGSE